MLNVQKRKKYTGTLSQFKASERHNECAEDIAFPLSVTSDVESFSNQSKERLQPPDEEITRSM